METINQLQIAPARYRVVALVINLVIGIIPVALPNLLQGYGIFDVASIITDRVLDALAVTLGFGQLLLVHGMGGSPGAVFAGLEVRYTNGKPLRFKTTFLRALPYLAALMASILMPRSVSEIGSNTHILVELLSWVYLSVLIFITVSGGMAMVSGRQSLIDRITHTIVIKAHRINV